MSEGPLAGLALVDAIEATGKLADQHLLPAVRADLLARVGRVFEARAAYAVAIDRVGNDAERRLLRKKLSALDGPKP
jgi:RNA polymerase sigma-70 factor (ECF subfamily)